MITHHYQARLTQGLPKAASLVGSVPRVRAALLISLQLIGHLLQLLQALSVAAQQLLHLAVKKERKLT